MFTFIFFFFTVLVVHIKFTFVRIAVLYDFCYKALMYLDRSTLRKVVAKILMTPVSRFLTGRIRQEVEKRPEKEAKTYTIKATLSTFTTLCYIKSRASWFSCIPLGRVVLMLFLNCREQLMIIEEANREKTQNLCKKPNLILIGNRVAKSTYHCLKRSWISWSKKKKSKFILENRPRF